jgi:membrane protein implicated in regulation of membrane protease activity
MIVGEIGEARRDDMVFVHGELWRAKPDDGAPLRPGQRVRVSGVGPELELRVEHLGDD